MFDDIKFTGTVNLGNIVNVVVYLLGALAFFIKVKAELAKHEKETGQKIETSLRKRLARPKKLNPGRDGADSQPPAKKEDTSADNGQNQV